MIKQSTCVYSLNKYKGTPESWVTTNILSLQLLQVRQSLHLSSLRCQSFATPNKANGFHSSKSKNRSMHGFLSLISQSQLTFYIDGLQNSKANQMRGSFLRRRRRRRRPNEGSPCLLYNKLEASLHKFHYAESKVSSFMTTGFILNLLNTFETKILPLCINYQSIIQLGRRLSFWVFATQTHKQSKLTHFKNKKKTIKQDPHHKIKHKLTN